MLTFPTPAHPKLGRFANKLKNVHVLLTFFNFVAERARSEGGWGREHKLFCSSNAAAVMLQ